MAVGWMFFFSPDNHASLMIEERWRRRMSIHSLTPQRHPCVRHFVLVPLSSLLENEFVREPTTNKTKDILHTRNDLFVFV